MPTITKHHIADNGQAPAIKRISIVRLIGPPKRRAAAVYIENLRRYIEPLFRQPEANKEKTSS